MFCLYLKSYDDKGPVIDAVVWHDGEVWRVALDTQSIEDDPDCGRLADFEPLTNFRLAGATEYTVMVV